MITVLRLTMVCFGGGLTDDLAEDATFEEVLEDATDLTFFSKSKVHFILCSF